MDVSAEVSDSIRTVVNVTWTTDEPTIGYVQYGPTEDMEFSTPLEAEEGSEHRMTLLGLKADTEYYYRVVTWDGDDGAASEVSTVATGELPGGLPAREVTGDGHDMLTVVPILTSTSAVITVIDPDGDIVWYHTDERADDGALQFFRARLSVDGKSVIYNAANVSGDPAENSELVRVALDGSGSDSVEVPFLAHDFVEHPDGTLAALVAESRDFEGAPLKGNALVEISPDGEQTTVWSSWDCFDPAVHLSDAPEVGWTFANALDYDSSEDVYYLGMRNFSSIARVDRSGECDWVLGLTGARGIDFAPGSRPFLHQHQFELIPGDPHDQLLVFDNEGRADAYSQVIAYELDLEAEVATELWTYMSDPPVFTFVLGEPIVLTGGDLFIAWSGSGQLERLNEDRESQWKVTMPSGFIFGFATVADTLYSPDANRP